jgi:photosystem I subunit 9
MPSGTLPFTLDPDFRFHPYSAPFAMKKFLTTAPVFAAIWFTITAGIMIEFNRFYPDLLFHPL